MQQIPVQRVEKISEQIWKVYFNLPTLNKFLLAGLYIWHKLDQVNYIGAIVKAKSK